MLKKLISLTPRQYNWIHKEARRAGISDSECIRKVLDAAIGVPDATAATSGWYLCSTPTCTEGVMTGMSITIEWRENGADALMGPYASAEEAREDLANLNSLDLSSTENKCDDSSK